jgi:hypothetical protein
MAMQCDVVCLFQRLKSRWQLDLRLAVEQWIMLDSWL